MKGAKTLLIAGAVASVGLAGIVGTGVVSAETTGANSSIVEKIATKFGLKEADVQAVFDQEHTERQAERVVDISDQLQDAVDDGDITAEQKKLIEAKVADQQKVREAERAALQKWADDNSIDMRYIMGGGRHGNNRLDNAVEDGDLTTEQQKLIEEKQAQLEADRDAAREEIEQWAEDNDIDLEYVHGFGMSGRGGGGAGMGGMRNN